MATSEIMQGLEETDGNSVLISAVPSVQPYQFEPRRPSTPIYSTDSETQSSSDENDHDENDRVDNTNWCECGQCVPMSTQSESCCCRENCLMDNLLVDSGLTCITEHEGFIGNCLNQYVVETSFYEYLDIYGQVGDDEPVHQPIKTSTPIARQTKSLKSSKSTTASQHANTGPDTSATRRYKMSTKQTKTWQPLDKELKNYLFKVIDTSVKAVGSKPAYIKEEDIQNTLSTLKKRLKSSIDKIKVPKKKYKSFLELKHTAAQLDEEYENLTNQQLQIEREIRQEERKIETLTDGIEAEELLLEVPEDVLNLPKMVFGRS